MNKHRFILVLALILLGAGVIQQSSNLVFAHPLAEEQVVSPQDEVDNCLACHTDKDALVSSAKAEEHVESENEGEG